jgi:hypothetical protein
MELVGDFSMTPSIALSAFQQKAVWENWLSSAIRSNYFADMAHRFDREQKISTGLTVLMSTGAFLTAITGLGHRAIAAFALLAAALSVWTLVQQNQKRVTDCLDLHFRWNRLAGEYRALWDDMYSEETLTKFAMLGEKMDELSKSSAPFPASKRRMLHWQNHVEMHVLGKTASA